MREQDQPGAVIKPSTVARREEMSPDAFDIDPHLASVGFTNRLPTLVRDLNYELGGNDFGDVNDTPISVTYRFDPHRFAPRVEKEEVFDYGPRIELTVTPEQGGANLKIGRIPQVSPDNGMSSWLPMDGFHEWTARSYITSARLEDLQSFLHDTFPGRKATLYRRAPSVKDDEFRIDETDEDLGLLTAERLQELPTTEFAGRLPYMVKIEGAYEPNRAFDPFLVVGIRHFQGGPTNPRDEYVFDIHALIYDAKKYNGSGQDVEKILDGIRQLWAKNPLIERYNETYRERARSIRERFLENTGPDKS